MMGWWLFTRSAIEALTHPRPDVAACDRAVEALARDSSIGRVLHHVSTFVRDAWAYSRARAAALSIARELMPASPVRAWRLRGWIGAASGATILALDAVKPVPAGPLAWVVPSLAIVAGFLTMAMAGPLARAADDRRARRNARSATA